MSKVGIIVRVGIVLAALAITWPALARLFRMSSRETAVLFGAVFFASAALSQALKTRDARDLEPLMGSWVKEPYRTGLATVYVLAGAVLIVLGTAGYLYMISSLLMQ
jgi:hypothetical protein